MKVYESIARTLLDVGIDRLFGLMGDANMQYLATYQDMGGTFIASSQENGAIMMADGYSRAVGRPGVASVTHGPGVTNGLTALTEAVRAHSPVVVITGETGGRDALQRLALDEAARLAGAEYVRAGIERPVCQDVAAALKFAETRRHAVLLDIPAPLMASDETGTSFQPDSLETESAVAAPDDDALDRALGIVASAQHPLILAGRGALRSGARDELVALAEALAAPLTTTLAAKDLFRGHPLDLGLFGTLSHSLAARYIASADCIVAVGAALGPRTTVNGSLLRGKALVHCDNDPAVLERTTAQAPVVADAKPFAAALSTHLAQADHRPAAAAASRLRHEIETFRPEDDFVDRSGERTIDIRTAAVIVDRMLPDRRIIVSDSGRFHHAAWRYLHARPGEFHYTASFGSIGLGLAAAIGVSVARPDELTVAVLGDGGAMMALGELAVVARQSPRLLILVINDGAYGAEYTKLHDYGLNPKYSLLSWPPFHQVAHAFGIEGVAVRRADELETALKKAASLARPLLVEIIADPAVDPGVFR
jgi:acetolactate synthase-1/2/3 large subunit